MIIDPLDLAGGFWRRHYPSPVPAGVVSAVVQAARAAGHAPAVGTAAASDWTSPVADPGWAAVGSAAGQPFLVAGYDFATSGKAVSFRRPPIAHAARGDPLDPTKQVVWFGRRPDPNVPGPTTQPPSADRVGYAAAAYAGSPAFTRAGAVTTVTQTTRGWVVATHAEAVVLPPADAPGVAVGDPVAPGEPAGLAWRAVRLGPGTPAEPYVPVPAELLPPGVSALALANAVTAVAVDAPPAGVAAAVPPARVPTANCTRVRWAVNTTAPNALAFWQAVEAAGLRPTLAELLDTRPAPTGQPTAAALPSAINPAEWACVNLFGGAAWCVFVDPARFGPTRDRAALAGAAGLHGCVFACAVGPTAPDAAGVPVVHFTAWPAAQLPAY